MEDKDLEKIFSDFRPNLSPDANFMAKLQKNLDRLELVEKHAATLRRRNRIAMTLAGCTGFVVGALFILLMPFAWDFMQDIKLNIGGLQTLPSYSRNLLWILLATAVTGLSATGVYELCMERLNSNSKYV